MLGISAFLLLIALLHPLSSRANRCSGPEEVVELGVQRSDGTKIKRRGVPVTDTQRWRPRIAEDRDARYVRLRIERIKEDAKGWSLAIRTPELRLVQTLGPADFSQRTVWSGRIPLREGDPSYWVDLDLELGEDGLDPDLRVKGYHAMPRRASRPFYSRTAGSREVDLFEAGSADWKIRGDAVGMLLANYDQDSWCCTGVFLTEDLFLTNWHCGGIPLSVDEGLAESLYWTGRVCESVVVDSSWDSDSWSREYVPETTRPCVESTDIDLDYALLRMRPRGSNGPMRPASIRWDEEVAKEEPLILLHHAGCLPKRLSDSCKVKEADHVSWRDDVQGTDFTHSCNTELGSSGAPVFDSAGRIVGLHHLGFQWNATCSGSDERNKAVKIGAILQGLPRALCLEIVGDAGADRCRSETP